MGVVGGLTVLGKGWRDGKTYGQRAPICLVVGDLNPQILILRHL